MKHHEIELPTGTLRLQLNRTEMALEELCEFAARRNAKRGFLFISKVLGKHWPVKPSTMRSTYQKLAQKVDTLRGGFVLIGFAETATGLAGGIFDELTQREDAITSLHLHTTRYRLDTPVAFEASESHSHAPCHRVYWPTHRTHRAIFQSAETLIVVDDEISTGATLVDLVLRYREINPKLRRVKVICLTNWISTERQSQIEIAIGLPTEFISLLEGQMEFSPNTALVSPEHAPPPQVDPVLSTEFFFSRARTGVSRRSDVPDPLMQACESLAPQSRVLVLGTGEFLHHPFLFAERLERAGFDVRFQSTTRSPIMPGPAIRSVLSFPEHSLPHVPNYLYNVDPKEYDQIFVCYEVPTIADEHRLAEMIGADPQFFSRMEVAS